MQIWSLGKLAVTATVLAAAAGCGDGEGTTSTGTNTVSYGTVTAIGSIFVNGVEYSTIGARVVRDDAIVNENQLRRGMVVDVQGTITNAASGVASTVAIQQAVRGFVESKAGTAAAGTILVLGQTVQVDDRTLYDASVPDFASIAAGMNLEVHGQRAQNGAIAATYIERKTGPSTYVVRGRVAGHNALATTFTLGTLTVNYGAGGAFIGDMPAPSGSNWNGLFVAANGAICNNTPVCGTLTASKVAPQKLSVANAPLAEVEGFVASFTSISSFSIGTQPVVTDASTLFLGGDPAEIALGMALEAEGSLSGGVLTATKVRFTDAVKIESNASASGATITALDGLPGITVTANAFTVFKNNALVTATNLAPLNLRAVRVRGRASGANSVLATEIDDTGVANASAPIMLQGIAESVAKPSFTILGVTANTSMLVDPGGFIGVNNTVIGSTAFYNAITPSGGLVKAQGKLPALNALGSGDLKEVALED